MRQYIWTVTAALTAVLCSTLFLFHAAPQVSAHGGTHAKLQTCTASLSSVQAGSNVTLSAQAENFSLGQLGANLFVEFDIYQNGKVIAEFKSNTLYVPENSSGTLTKTVETSKTNQPGRLSLGSYEVACNLWWDNNGNEEWQDHTASGSEHANNYPFTVTSAKLTSCSASPTRVQGGSDVTLQARATNSSASSLKLYVEFVIYNGSSTRTIDTSPIDVANIGLFAKTVTAGSDDLPVGNNTIVCNLWWDKGFFSGKEQLDFTGPNEDVQNAIVIVTEPPPRAVLETCEVSQTTVQGGSNVTLRARAINNSTGSSRANMYVKFEIFHSGGSTPDAIEQSDTHSLRHGQTHTFTKTVTAGFSSLPVGNYEIACNLWWDKRNDEHLDSTGEDVSNVTITVIPPSAKLTSCTANPDPAHGGSTVTLSAGATNNATDPSEVRLYVTFDIYDSSGLQVETARSASQSLGSGNSGTFTVTAEAGSIDLPVGNNTVVCNLWWDKLTDDNQHMDNTGPDRDVGNATVTVTSGTPSGGCRQDIGQLVVGLDQEGLNASGALTNACNSRFYRFTLRQEARIQIDLSSEDFDSYLYLTSEDGRTIFAENDNVGGPSLVHNTDSRISHTLTPGTYFIHATTSDDEEQGNFTLSVSPIGFELPDPTDTFEESIYAFRFQSHDSNFIFTKDSGHYWIFVPNRYTTSLLDKSWQVADSIDGRAFDGIGERGKRSEAYKTLLLELAIQPEARGDVYVDFEKVSTTLSKADIINEAVIAYAQGGNAGLPAVGDAGLLREHLNHLHANGIITAATFGTIAFNVAVAVAANRTIEVENARRNLDVLEKASRMSDDKAWSDAFRLAREDLDAMTSEDGLERWRHELEEHLDEISVTVSKILVKKAATKVAVTGLTKVAAGKIVIATAPISLTVGLIVVLVDYAIQQTDHFWDNFTYGIVSAQVYMLLYRNHRDDPIGYREFEDAPGRLLKYIKYSFYKHLYESAGVDATIFNLIDEPKPQHHELSILQRRDLALKDVLGAKFWNPTEDFYELGAAGNGSARGIWSDGNTMWVADAGILDQKIYAYTLRNKTRDSSKDLDLSGAVNFGNADPRGIWSNGITMYVADSADDKIYAYTLRNNTRDSSKDLDLKVAGNMDARGIWSNGITMYVADSADDKIYAYSLSTNEREEDREIDLLRVNIEVANKTVVIDNDEPRGIWSDGSTMWVADDDDDKIYAYSLSANEREEDREVDLLRVKDVLDNKIIVDNVNPTGIWSDGSTIWVADHQDDRIYAYSLSEPPLEQCEPEVIDDQVLTGNWTSECTSENQSGSYARYYTFSLTQEAEVTVTLESSVNTYLNLLEGAGRDGRLLHSNNDITPGNTNSRIQETLSAGSYTVEATTYSTGVAGEFTLTFSRQFIPPEPAPTFTASSVSAGSEHTCALRTDGSVVCWGRNSHGQSSAPAGVFTSVSTGGAHTSVSAGAGHTCGVKADGTVACWGDNFDGQSSAPAGSFASVSAGGGHTCGLRPDGSVACWGDNFDGQSSAPAGSFASVSAGGRHTCGLKTDGTVICWGDDRFGQSSAPSGSFASISAGGRHTCGLKTDGTVTCWGYDDYGQSTPPSGSFASVNAGDGHTCGLKTDGTVTCWGNDDYGEWTWTPPSGSFASVSAGGRHTCGLKTDGTVTCWGDNFDGQSSAPAGSFASVSAGRFHTCGLKTDGTVACWGDDGFGQSSAPAGSFASVSAGGVHTCGLKTDGTVICWGDNLDGQSSAPAGSFASVSAGGFHTCGLRPGGTATCWGDDGFGQSSAPAGSFASVSGGGVHTCGLKTDGTIACWGDDGFGQSPAPSGSFASVSAGRFHTCGLKTDGTIACWGDDGFGQSPAPSGSFASVSTGRWHTCGLKTDGTVICWGDDRFGQSPAPSGSFASVSTGRWHTCGLKTEGNVICWGLFNTIHPSVSVDGTSPEPPADSCESTLSEDGTVSGSWSDDCASENQAGSYARYYIFTLTESAEVTVTLQSSVNTYLHLLEGDGRYGRSLYHNDDAPGAGTNSQIEETLSAGIYTIEATTYDAGVEGRFTLTISRLSGATGDDTLVDRYDANDNGQIDKSEVIAAINDYLFGEGDEQITKEQVIEIINLYLFG